MAFTGIGANFTMVIIGKRRRRNFKSLFMAAIPIVGIAAFALWQMMDRSMHEKHYRDLFLYKINHNQLLQSCRYVIANRVNFKTNCPGITDTNILFIDFRNADPDTSDIPKEILKLKPYRLSITKNCLVLVFYSDYFLKAFATEANELDLPDTTSGDKKLIDGLYLCLRH